MNKFYVLISQPFTETAPGFMRTGTYNYGEVVPERTFQVGERAVYRLKKVPGRFYRRDYPNPGDNCFFLAKVRTLLEAVELRDRINDRFEVYEWVNGQLGGKVDV